MDISTIKQYLYVGWSMRTSADPDGWCQRGPAWGQCAVSALYVQDKLGGDIVRITYQTPSGAKGSHYLNVLTDGTKLDLTDQQFPAHTEFDPPYHRSGVALKIASEEYLAKEKNFEGSMRDYLLSNHSTKECYQRLCRNISKHLSEGAQR